MDEGVLGCGGRRSTDIPALGEDYAEEEEDEEAAGTDPAVCGIGGSFVEVGLVELLGKMCQYANRVKF